MTKITLHEFLPELFKHTEQSVYVCSFPNERDDPNQATERHITTRVAAQVEAFASKWDKPGRGAFFCVGTVKAGTKRNKDNIVETIGLHADIDFKSVEGSNIDLAEVTKQLARLRIQPSVTLFSGGGVHAYWLFTEPLATQESTGAISNIERIEDALKLLADLVAGDPSVCEVSRVMRLPQTHNTKGGHWTEVEITSFNPDRRYELDDLEEWLSEVSPVMLRKERERSVTVGETGGETNFFLKWAEENGVKTPIDVEQRLRGMMYMGSGESSVHQTQITVSASMLNSGHSMEETVATVLEATRIAAGLYGSRWNWKREERNIRRMCESWIKKHPPERQQAERELKSVEKGFTELREEQEAAKQQASGGGAQGAQVIQMVPPPKPQTPPPVSKKSEQHITLGRAVLAGMRANGEQIINTRDGAWFYTHSVWELRTDAKYKWLDVRIEDGCRGLNFKSTTKLVNETRNWIVRNPELWRDGELPWDQHGKIPVRNGLIDPITGTLEASKPEHFCTWRIEVDHDLDAKCPWWEMMVADMFGDKEKEEQIALGRVIQECLGAALIDRKPRALTKALVFWGGSNQGKSGLVEVCGGLFGDVISQPLGTLDGSHGLMPFTRRLPWVLHEAFGGTWHFSQTVKAIITHEPVMINIKNGPMQTTIVRAPIFWATNFQPTFKEASKAIVNRMIVIECSRVFNDDKPIGTAAEAIRQGYAKPANLILNTELSGVLNWAMEGLRRALKRGSIEVTASIRETSEMIRRDGNLAAGFMDDCVEFNHQRMVSAPDFCAAFSVWYLEQKGEDRRLPSNEAIGRALRALGEPRIALDLRDKTKRYYAGVTLNDEGMAYWQRAVESRLFEGKTVSTTSPSGGTVNMVIPEAWDTKPSIVIIRGREHLVTVV